MPKLDWRVDALDLLFARENNGGLYFGKTAPQPLNVKRIWWVNKKHKKKIKRRVKKKKEKAAAQQTQERLKKQMGLFERLPSQCSACSKPFPKTREAHMTWQVVVRHDEETVRLFCPACQAKAQQLMENNNEV